MTSGQDRETGTMPPDGGIGHEALGAWDAANQGTQFEEKRRVRIPTSDSPAINHVKIR